jgi:hypothetical protein
MEKDAASAGWVRSDKAMCREQKGQAVGPVLAFVIVQD